MSCKCSGCVLGETLHYRLEVIERHRLEVIERHGSALAYLPNNTMVKLTATPALVSSFYNFPEEETKEEKKEAPSITVDALTHALLKTHGRYDSKQDQAAAIMKILEEQCKKPSDTK